LRVPGNLVAHVSAFFFAPVLGAAGLLFALLIFLAFWAVPANAPVTVFVSRVSSFYLSCVIPIFAFLSGAGALRDDLKPGSGDYLFTRPVRRPLYFAFRVVAQTLCLLIDFLLALGTLAFVAWLRKVPGLPDVLPALFWDNVSGAFLRGVWFSLRRADFAVCDRRACLRSGCGDRSGKFAHPNQQTGVNKAYPFVAPEAFAGATAFENRSSDSAFRSVRRCRLDFGVFRCGVVDCRARFFHRQERSGSRPQEG